ncbi:jg23741 [Pararge aegeria aegeria]|uniref:Jg23741 protein n=1 Tax=Pararge aegeria aegeria TaxID=348720 RepID=A0A8S4REE3_9NEOP|nr:jg23741 [Pararge aegeria aegeria]
MPDRESVGGPGTAGSAGFLPLQFPSAFAAFHAATPPGVPASAMHHATHYHHHAQVYYTGMIDGDGFGIPLSPSEVQCTFGLGSLTPEAGPSVPINDCTLPHLTRCCDNCHHVFISKRSNYITHNGLDTIGYFGSVRLVKVDFVPAQKRCCESAVV